MKLCAALFRTFTLRLFAFGFDPVIGRGLPSALLNITDQGIDSINSMGGTIGWTGSWRSVPGEPLLIEMQLFFVEPHSCGRLYFTDGMKLE